MLQTIVMMPIFVSIEWITNLRRGKRCFPDYKSEVQKRVYFTSYKPEVNIVLSTEVCFANGNISHPTCAQVCSHTIGFAEMVK